MTTATNTPTKKQLLNLIMDMNRSLKVLNDKVETHGLDFQMAHKCIDDAENNSKYLYDSLEYETKTTIEEQNKKIEKLEETIQDQNERIKELEKMLAPPTHNDMYKNKLQAMENDITCNNEWIGEIEYRVKVSEDASEEIDILRDEVQKYKKDVDVLRTTCVKLTETNEELTEALYQDSIVRDNVKKQEHYAGSISKDIVNQLFKADEMALILNKKPVLRILLDEKRSVKDEMNDDIVLNYYCSQDIITSVWIKKDTHPLLRYKFKKEMSREEFNNMALHRHISHMMYWWNRNNTYKIKFDDGIGETEIIEELQDVLDMDYDKTYDYIVEQAWKCYKNKTN